MKYTSDQLQQIRYIPKNSTPLNFEHINAVVYLYEQNNKFYAIAYYGKSIKNSFHINCLTNKQRQEHIEQWTKSIATYLQHKKERTETRKRFTHNLQKGQILYSTWGYDQTNVDFYEVIEVKSNKTVVIRELASKQIEDSFMQGNATPRASTYIGEPMLKRVSEGNCIKINSFSYAKPWHGRPIRYSNYA